MRRPPFQRGRPGWWPENEPWPPRPPLQRRLRGFFFWRLAGALAFLSLLLFGAVGLAAWLVLGLGAEVTGLPREALSLVCFGGLFLFVFALGLVVRTLVRLAWPMGALMEAAGQVEAGDYTGRVPERGPREMRAFARAFNHMTARLEADELQRRRLLADISHELRTPLAVIQGNLEGMADGVYPADAAHLASVLEETRQLSRLIDDLRTLALADSGALQLRREPTDLGVLAGETCASFRPQADAAGVVLELALADDLPLAEVDPVRLREVLANLIANALRHTPAGGRISLSGQRSAGGQAVELAVSDTGPGIPAEALPHIFDRFYKTPDSPGSGLGLAIARDLVRAHGGEIQAESQAGRGTRLWFSLPLEP